MANTKKRGPPSDRDDLPRGEVIENSVSVETAKKQKHATIAIDSKWTQMCDSHGNSNLKEMNALLRELHEQRVFRRHFRSDRQGDAMDSGQNVFMRVIQYVIQHKAQLFKNISFDRHQLTEQQHKRN